MQLQTKYLEVPNEEQRENVRKSVNSTLESIKRDVQHLIEWFEKQPHLPNFKDEHLLAHNLIHCGNSLEKSKDRLEKYFIAKASFPEVFYDRNPFEEALEKQKNHGMYVPLRKLTPEGYRVLMLYLADDLGTKNDIPPINNFLKINEILIELLGKVDFCRGIILLQDGTNFNLHIVAALSSYLKKMLYLSEKAIPVSYAKIYFFNMGQASNIVLTLVKPLIKKKIAERIEILKNPTDLYNVLPKEIIPREFGGDELPLEQLKDLWFEDIKNNYEYLKSFEKLTSDLSKIPRDSTTTELSGLAGSFRQISID